MYSLLLIVHFAALFGMVGLMFVAYFSADGGLRKKVLMWSGIAALVALLTGLGMVGRLEAAGLEHHGWIAVKFLCWLVLAAVPGLLYRKRDCACKLFAIGLGAVLIAIVVAVLKPF